MRAYIIVGMERTKKSATTRALTGITGGRKIIPVATRNPNEIIELFVQSQSPQEEPCGPDDFAKRLLTEAQGKNILINLRTTHKPLGGADVYLEAIKAVGWCDIFRVELNSPKVHKKLRDIVGKQNCFTIPNTKTPKRAVNSIANEIRCQWNWQ